MALNFGNSPGTVFNSLGKLSLLIKQMRSYQTTQLTNCTNTTSGVIGQLINEPDIQALMGTGYFGVLSGAESAGSIAQNIAQNYINRLVFRDNPQPNQDLTTVNLTASIAEVIRQMKQQGATVLAMTVTTTPTSFTGVGNGVINVSTKRPFDGAVLENAFSETLFITCSSDSYTGSGTAFNEGFSLQGEKAQTDFFAFNWPVGSGAGITFSNIDGDTSNGSGNVLTNSNFSTWTSNVPSNWSLTTGTAGTSIVQETGLTFGSGSAVKVVGDGTTKVSFKQQFGVSTGTLATLSPLTQYGAGFFLRRDGNTSNAGVLTVDLIDQNGTVINDQKGTPNSFTVDLTLLGTGYQGFTGAFRTPNILPTQQFIRFTTSTAYQNSRNFYLAKASCGLMNQTYTSGPYVCAHAGSIPAVLGDYATVAVNNSRGAGGTLDTFQTAFARVFAPTVISNEFLLPSAAAPSISDLLIA